MANNQPQTPSDDFFDQILGFQTASYGGGGDANLAGNHGSSLSVAAHHLHQHRHHQGGQMMVQLNSGFVDSRSAHHLGGMGVKPPMQKTVVAVQHPPPAMRPRVRARRGQATDPHSIAERLRRERIAERIRALQELVPSVNKTDRAAMLDEIVDYVKFLRLQVKVLSMSRLGGAGAVAPLVADNIPISSVEEEGGKRGRKQAVGWDKWSNDGTERQVAKLMEENVGAALQLLQSKALCIMPISLASAIYPPS